MTVRSVHEAINSTFCLDFSLSHITHHLVTSWMVSAVHLSTGMASSEASPPSSPPRSRIIVSIVFHHPITARGI